MSRLSAFQASYADWKLIKTRKVVQIVFEVPVEQAGLAYEVLDGMPNYGSEVWCAIARLNLKQEEAAKPRPSSPDKAPAGGAPRAAAKSFHEMPAGQQAGILCREPAFIKFLSEELAAMVHGCRVVNAEQATIYVREFCGVLSRSEIETQPTAMGRWRRLVSDYRAWMREPAVVA